MSRLIQPTLQEVLRYRRVNDHDDWPERETAKRAFRQILGKKFMSFTECQPCVDIMADDGSASVEIELNKRWINPNYPYKFMRIPHRKIEEYGLRDMVMGKDIFLVEQKETMSWKGMNVYYAQVPMNYQQIAYVSNKTILKYTTKEYLKPLENQMSDIYRDGNLFYWIPLSEVKISYIDW